MLSDAQVDAFVAEGFVRVDGAFSAETATAAREILWRATGCDPEDPATWNQPVIRLPGFGDEPFRVAARSPLLARACDQLVGPGRWVPRNGLGTFPIRFPSDQPPGDDGWHIDASFAGDDDDPSDYGRWRVNVVSKGRGLLMLFLFSDVGPQDAPTRIRAGSHLRMARVLEPYGEAGVPMFDLVDDFATTADLPEVAATGRAGDVYLCHPFLVHAAQPHRGAHPKFMAQPPLELNEEFRLERPDGDYVPVEAAVRRGLGR
ncbi:phytanoyl-CoA dioxygenase (PhyH)-like protein [Nocardia nova SH22a]|uniref:Phytanoyl-CoA dioxygenase (PhyH)-like protein n=1 Tax=Nocardia nova SH22a TaxID=1415166 RepID=W5T7Y5_9NOCA|nr:phytanoyl-CoA dioxygenase family protein [Nocardia nova]AHH15259.1 phytanoyl-CoA dioxygenase (PhyH)-like protein [Nocardia nova SH22a]